MFIERLIKAIVTILIICPKYNNGILLNLNLDEYTPCEYEDTIQEDESIGEKCHLLELFNQTLVDEIVANNYTKYTELLDTCSCKLISMSDLWKESYDFNEIRRVSSMVNGAIEKHSIESIKQLQEQEQTKLTTKVMTTKILPDNYPKFLWSDIDISFYGISIHTATKDYFLKQQQSNSALEDKIQYTDIFYQMLKDNEIWKLIRKACKRIAKDTNKLYRYLENLNRISFQAFYNVLTNNAYVEMTYQASKACKMLILKNLRHYRVRPINRMLVPVVFDDALLEKNIHSNMSLELMLIYEQQQREIERTSNINNDNQEEDNNLSEEDYLSNSKSIDSNLEMRSAYLSTYLLNCGPWQRKKFSISELRIECPMMMQEEPVIPDKWLNDHTTILSRSKMAVKCACQLLLHNDTWPQILKHKDVQIMATALTSYLNENSIPNFITTPIKAINSWFESIMEKFKTNGVLSIRQVIKTKYQNQDPTFVIERKFKSSAMETLRRGCNYIMFNYNKGTPDSIGELLLIKYLDNLQLISPDKLFTFDLTLQDPNLFKLNALSKMCLPIVF